MSNIGVAHFYYGRQLPQRAVAIADITARPSSPADLTDIANIELSTPRRAGKLTVSQYPNGLVFDAADLNRAIPISGSLNYTVENQFFEVTPIVIEGKPLFYHHPFEMGGVENVGVVDLDGNAASGYTVRNNALYHSFDGRPYWVSYYADGVLRTELLKYSPVMTRTTSPTATSYAWTPGGLLTLFNDQGYWIRV